MLQLNSVPYAKTMATLL